MTDLSQEHRTLDLSVALALVSPTLPSVARRLTPAIYIVGITLSMGSETCKEIRG